MAVGQALARGIQMGEASRRGSQLNLEQIIASLPGTRGWQRTRRSPAIIRSNAAEMALNERKLDLMEREQDLEERKQIIVEESVRKEQQRQYHIDVEARGIRRRGETQVAEDRAHEAQLRASEAKGVTAATGKAERKSAQMDDYNLAKAGLGSGNAAPVLQYFDRYGDTNMRIEDIQFGKGPNDPVQVTFNNAPDKPVTFSNSGEAMMMLLAPTNPELGAGAPARKEAREERKVVAKEAEVEIKGAKGKELTASEGADQIRKIGTDVDRIIERNPKPAQYETDEDWRRALIEQRRGEVLGPVRGVPTREEIPPSAQEGAPQYQETQIRHRETGEVGTRRIYPDGTQEILDSKGNLIERRAAEGRRYAPPTGTRGEVHALPIKREEPAAGVPERAERPARPERARAVAYHTDAEGNKVESRVNAQGEVETRIVETKGERDKKKKKKKKRSKKNRKD